MITSLKKPNLRKGYNGDFNGKIAKDTLLSSLWERLAAFWTPDMTRYLMEPIRVDKDSKRTPHERLKSIKLHKRSFSKETAVLTTVLTYFNVRVSDKPTALFQSISLRMAANPSSRKRTNLAKKVGTDDKDQEILMNFKKQANYRERKKKANCETMKWKKNC